MTKSINETQEAIRRELYRDVINAEKEYREKNGDSTIVLYVSEDYIRAFEESADVLSEVCGFQLDQRAGIRFSECETKHSIWVYPELVRNGYKIMIIN